MPEHAAPGHIAGCRLHVIGASPLPGKSVTDIHINPIYLWLRTYILIRGSAMKSLEAVKTLALWDRQDKSVFSVADLRRVFPERSEKTFSEGLRRLVAQGVLERAARAAFM